MFMRILLVAPLPPPPGGISTWTKGLLEFALNDSRVEIVNVSSSVRYRSAGNLGLTMRVIGGCLHGVVLFTKFAVALLSNQIDVVHINSSGSFGMYRDLVMVAFARSLRVPVVLHLRFGRVPSVAASRNWEAALIRTICRLAQRVIVLDSASAEALRTLAPNCSVYVIPNPAWKLAEVSDARAEYGKAKVIVFCGHVIPNKGIRELVLACCGIKNIDFRLHLIGPIQEGFREELHAIACARADGEWLNISGQVEREEALSGIGRGFAFVLPSYTEGFPNVVIEAMMLGKPVIATRVGAIPEMLSDGGDKPCGVCVPVGDVDALRNAIKSLLNEPGQALEMGQRGRERVMREYSAGVVYPQYKSIWKSAVVGHNPAAV